MNYKTFKTKLENDLKTYAEKNDYEISYPRLAKTNKVKDGISLRKKSIDIAPIMYVDDLYQSYKIEENYDFVYKNVIKAFEDSFFSKVMSDNLKQNFTFDNVKDNIIFTLINTKQNEALLKDIPHREFYDLSIIYKIVLEENAFCTITNDLIHNFNVSEEDLYHLSRENTRRIYPPAIAPLSEILEYPMFVPEENDLIILTNNEYIYGAVYMCYDDILNSIADKLNSNFFIIPSSIHEILIKKCDENNSNDLNSKDLSEIIYDINQNKVSLDMQLSNQLYLYDKETKSLSIISNNVEKLSNCNEDYEYED